MSPEFGTIRISQQGKDQLIKLKRATGIKNWNTLCRWALCVSLSEPGTPSTQMGSDSNVEMSWRTFSGGEANALGALVVMRSRADGTIPMVALQAHLHRGIGRLSGLISRDGTIDDLATLMDLH